MPVKLTKQDIRKMYVEARRRDKKQRIKVARDAWRTQTTTGYQCPKCWKRFDTREERLLHRESHWEATP